MTPCRSSLPLLAALGLGLALALPAHAQLAGDLNDDCIVDAADALLLQRHLSGVAPIPGLAASGKADLAPLDAAGDPDPDGATDLADLLVLLETLSGPVSAPLTLTDPGYTTTTANPVSLAGTNPEGATVRLFVNGVETFAPPAVTGTQWTASGASAVALFDGLNTIQAQIEIDGFTSCLSAATEITYTSTGPRTFTGPTSISDDSVWTPGSGDPYEVSGTLTVAPGVTLTIQPGTVVELDSGATLVVDGTLHVLGDPDNRPVFTSPAQTRGSWTGIQVRGEGTTIDSARILYAQRGVQVFSPYSAVVRDTEILEYATDGIRLDDGAGASIVGNQISNPTSPLGSNGIMLWDVSTTVLIEANTIEGATDCIHVRRSSPQILDNTIRNCVEGIEVKWSSYPLISGNEITDNTRGIDLTVGFGGPGPVVNDNRIHSNSGIDMTAGSNNWPDADVQTLQIDAQNNYWGTAVPSEIEDRIRHRVDDLFELPAIDYVPFQDAFGEEVPQGENQLSGLIEEDTTLDADTEYEVLGAFSVVPGATLTVQAGTVLKFHPGGLHLAVDGALQVQGTVTNPAIFTVASSSPARGDWRGIDILGDGSQIDYARIEFAGTGVEVFEPYSVVVINTQILEFSSDGVRIVDGAGATLTGNEILNQGSRQGQGVELEDVTGNVVIHDNRIEGAAEGIRLEDSSPEISDNEIHDTNAALYVKWQSSPTITGNTLSGNDKGIVFEEAGGGPTPTINGNRIFDNPDFNLHTDVNWSDAATIQIDAANNYWGSEEEEDIEGSIYHRNDNSSAPFVITYPYLDASGVPVDTGGTVLAGQQSGTLDPATDYTVVGALTVAAGDSLTVPAGTEITFLPGTSLIVDGVLTVEGADGNEAVFTSGTQARGAWKGIEIRANGSTIDHARIEYVQRGIEIVAPYSTTITNTEILEFSDDGIRLEDGAGASIVGNEITNIAPRQGDGILLVDVTGAVTIQDNLIRGAKNGIFLQRSSPQILDNDILDNDDGVEIKWGCTPTLTGNEITTNSRGIALKEGIGDPVPTVNENRIHANGVNFTTGLGWRDGSQGLVIDAESNYWGNTDPAVVEGTLFHRNDDPEAPILDYLPLRDGSSTDQPVGNQLIGALDDTTPLTAGADYDVVGWIAVPAGSTLTLPEGVTLSQRPGTGIVVLGTLSVSGTSASPVTLHSGESSPARGDWHGIQLLDASTGNTVSHIVLEHTVVALEVRGSDLSLDHATIREFQGRGVAYLEGSTGSITASVIDNLNQTGTGIYLDDSSPSIAGTTVRSTANGLHAVGDSHPSVTGGNLFDANAIAIRLTGSRGSGPDPDPVITNNQLLGTNAVSLHLEDYPVGTSAPIDARQNWWGTTAVADIRASITTDRPDGGVVDFSSYLDGPGGSPATGSANQFSALASAISASPAVFAPTLGETTTIGFTLHQSAEVTMRIYAELDDERETLLYEDSQVMAPGARSFVWDGRHEDGTIVPDEAYAYRLVFDTGTDTSVYDPDRDFAVKATPDEPLPGHFDNFRNDYWKFTYTLEGAPARVLFRASPDGGPVFNFIDQKPFAEGSHLIVFDGRKPDGSLINMTTTFYVGLPVKLKPNSVIVHRTAPAVTGTLAAPNVEVKSNPYIVYHSYEQLSNMVFRLDQDARVTVKILKPGFGDPDDPSGVVAVLIDDELRFAGVDHSFGWRGFDPAGDTNEIFVAEEGPYTFTIEAVHPVQPELGSLYRGVLNLRR